MRTKIRKRMLCSKWMIAFIFGGGWKSPSGPCSPWCVGHGNRAALRPESERKTPLRRSEKSGQKVRKSALRIDYSEIKILRPQIREIWEFSKTLETKHLYFLYIFRAFKMTHFALQNGPFELAEWFILSSRMGHFEMQNGPFWKSALFLLLSCTTFLPKKNESGSEKSKKTCAIFQ